MARQPSPVVLLGVPFHRVTMDDTLEWMARAVRERRPSYVATANVDFAAQASRDVELQRILLEADLVLCDGTPLIWASRWMKAPLPERVAGSDLVPKLCARAEIEGWRMYFLGATDEVLHEAKRRLLLKHPRLQIVGMESPPHRQLHEFDNEELNARIRTAAPDILLVAFGCPKQEKWILMNYRKIDVPVCMGIGATLDFIAGKFSRAPRWMGSLGLEWIYRLIQEPRRLASRYLLDLFFFARSAARQKLALTQHNDRSLGHSTQMGSHLNARVLVWSGRIDAATLISASFHKPEPTPLQPSLILDLSSTTAFDSSGLGFLVTLHKKCHTAGGHLALAAVPDRVLNMIRAVHLESVFHREPSVIAASIWISEQKTETTPAHEEGKTLELGIKGDLRAENADYVFEHIEKAWHQYPESQGLRLDLSTVDYMDSTGLSVLIRSFKLASQRPGSRFELTGATPGVRNVLELARLDHVLGLNT